MPQRPRRQLSLQIRNQSLRLVNHSCRHKPQLIVQGMLVYHTSMRVHYLTQELPNPLCYQVHQDDWSSGGTNASRNICSTTNSEIVYCLRMSFRDRWDLFGGEFDSVRYAGIRCHFRDGLVIQAFCQYKLPIENSNIPHCRNGGQDLLWKKVKVNARGEYLALGQEGFVEWG